MQKFDKHTIGKNPASVYLVELLNTEEYNEQSFLLKRIAHFRHTFKSMERSVETGGLDINVGLRYCELERPNISKESDNLLNLGVPSLLVNLYSNIITADIRKFERKFRKVLQIQHSAKKRALSVYKNQKLVGEHKIETYGKVTSSTKEHYNIVVTIKDGVVMSLSSIDINDVFEEITDVTRTEKSKSKLGKKNKVCTFY